MKKRIITAILAVLMLITAGTVVAAPAQATSTTVVTNSGAPGTTVQVHKMDGTTVYLGSGQSTSPVKEVLLKKNFCTYVNNVLIVCKDSIDPQTWYILPGGSQSVRLTAYP